MSREKKNNTDSGISFQWLVFFINSNKVFCGTTSFTLCIIVDREMDSTYCEIVG